MPVLYSPLTASTARMATTAWPNWTPLRLSLVVSTGQALSAGQVTAAVAAALTAAVSTTVAASSQAGPVTVRTLVHSACSASRRPAHQGAQWAGRDRPSGGPGGRGGQRLAHASLRRRTTVARPRASAA